MGFEDIKILTYGLRFINEITTNSQHVREAGVYICSDFPARICGPEGDLAKKTMPEQFFILMSFSVTL
jgi:hypothetical protein